MCYHTGFSGPAGVRDAKGAAVEGWRTEALACYPAADGGPGHLRYHWRGPADAEPLVCVHGFLDHGGSFAHLGPVLAERWKVVLLDRRGYGHSDWAAAPYSFWDGVTDLARLVDHLGSARVALLGHSAGTYICAAYAASHPQRVSSLALLEAYPIRPLSTSLGQRLRAWIDGQKTPPRRKRYPSLEAALERLGQAQPRVPDDLRRAWGRQGLEELADGSASFRYDPRHRLREPTRPTADEVAALLAEVQCPTLAIRGGASPIPDFPAALLAIPGVRTAVIADAAHTPHLEKPHAFLGALRRLWE